MRIVVMGTGGVGGYFGARLAQAGHDVTFVARGRHLEAIRADGLRIASPCGDLHLKQVKATDNPAEIGTTDLVLFCVKLWDTVAAAESIKPMLGEQTAVVSFQNSVVKDDILRQILGVKHVVGGACYIAAIIADPGLIQHTGTMQKLVFGEYDGTVTPRVTQFHDACIQAGIDVGVSSNIQQTIWEKFVLLVGLSATTSTARTPIGPIRGNERARAFLLDVMDEVVQVARAEGVSLPADYAKDRLAFLDQVPATMTSSMHGDLERGHRLELAWLSGDVVARGVRLGIATPCNRAVFDILSVHSNGQVA